jgi:hypothetical protein
MSIANRDWYAWIDEMPPPPNHLHVVGDVFVGNPGVEALLTMKEPQGTDPAVLLLDLHLVQRPGMWSPVMTWIQARYDRTLPPGGPRFVGVQVLLNDSQLARMSVHFMQ